MFKKLAITAAAVALTGLQGCATDTEDGTTRAYQQGQGCDTMSGIHTTKASLAVAMAQELGELDPVNQLTTKNGKVALADWVDAFCAAGGLGDDDADDDDGAASCDGLVSWAGNDWQLAFSAGEIIEHNGERYEANQNISYPNAACAPDSPAGWCADWFTHLGACGAADDADGDDDTMSDGDGDGVPDGDGCPKTRALLAFQDSAVSNYIPQHVLNPIALKEDLKAALQRQKDWEHGLSLNDPDALPPAHVLTQDGEPTDLGACGVHYTFETAPADPADTLEAEDLKNRMTFFGGDQNPYLAVMTDGSKIMIDPDSGDTSNGGSGSGACDATVKCARWDPKPNRQRVGDCCVCNGVYGTYQVYPLNKNYVACFT